MVGVKRSFEETRCDESDGTSTSTESDAEPTYAKRGRRGACHKPRPPRKRLPFAFIQQILALQSELRKLQYAWLREEHVLRKSEQVKVCQVAEKGISMLMFLFAGQQTWQLLFLRMRLLVSLRRRWMIAVVMRTLNNDISESESAHGDMVETTINTRRCTSTTASDVPSSTFVAP